MIALKRILVATDFSPHSEAALDLALSLPRHEGAALTLLHVCQMPTYAYFGGGSDGFGDWAGLMDSLSELPGSSFPQSLLMKSGDKP